MAFLSFGILVYDTVGSSGCQIARLVSHGEVEHCWTCFLVQCCMIHTEEFKWYWQEGAVCEIVCVKLYWTNKTTALIPE